MEALQELMKEINGHQFKVRHPIIAMEPGQILHKPKQLKGALPYGKRMEQL